MKRERGGRTLRGPHVVASCCLRMLRSPRCHTRLCVHACGHFPMFHLPPPLTARLPCPVPLPYPSCCWAARIFHGHSAWALPRTPPTASAFSTAAPRRACIATLRATTCSSTPGASCRAAEPRSRGACREIHAGAIKFLFPPSPLQVHRKGGRLWHVSDAAGHEQKRRGRRVGRGHGVCRLFFACLDAPALRDLPCGAAAFFPLMPAACLSLFHADQSASKPRRVARFPLAGRRQS